MPWYEVEATKLYVIAVEAPTRGAALCSVADLNYFDDAQIRSTRSTEEGIEEYEKIY